MKLKMLRAFLLPVYLCILGSCHRETVSIESVVISPDITELRQGETARLYVSVLPAGVSQEVVWVSSDAACVAVTASGTVTAVSDSGGTPVFTVEGYKIKATLGDYTEYFYPSGVPSVRTTTGSNNETKSFRKGSETLYLTLRSDSASRFSVDGLSPVSFTKIMEISQERRKTYYTRLSSYYCQNNPMSRIRFLDGTESANGGDRWRRILADTVETFNLCLEEFGAHLAEAGSAAESDNYVVYGNVPDNYAGLCYFNRNLNRFTLYVNADPMMIGSDANVKSTLIHEMGHLLGFSDSAYALSDTLYSYSRDKEMTTFFQPNDIATLKYWLNMPQIPADDGGIERYSVNFDYTYYDDPEAAADLVAEGTLEYVGTETFDLGYGIVLDYGLFAIRSPAVYKGVVKPVAESLLNKYSLATGDILVKLPESSEFDVSSGGTYRLYLKQYDGLPYSFLNPQQGAVEIR